MSAEEQAAAGCVIGEDYPEPIVDHAHERRRALERYRGGGGAAGGARRGRMIRIGVAAAQGVGSQDLHGPLCGEERGSLTRARRATPTAATTTPPSVTWTSELASETLRKRLRTSAISEELARHDDVGDGQRPLDVGDEERQRVQRAADERRAAGDDARAASAPPRPVSVPSSDSASDMPMLIAAPSAAARPTSSAACEPAT